MLALPVSSEFACHSDGDFNTIAIVTQLYAPLVVKKGSLPMSDAQTRLAIEALTVSELEADPHGVLRRYRAIAPVVRHEGLGFLVLRANDIDRLIRDPRARATETEVALRRGITG